MEARRIVEGKPEVKIQREGKFQNINPA